MKKLSLLLFVFICFFSFFSVSARDTMPDTWVGADDLGRVLPVHAEVGGLKAGKTIGMFYFISHTGDNMGGLIDHTRAYRLNGVQGVWDAIETGDNGYIHYWSEPYFGYYRTDDPWVIRKHAQLLSDIGVDFIFCDVSNGFPYTDAVIVLLDTYLAMRAEGNDTPQVCFMGNDGGSTNLTTCSFQDLFDRCYSQEKYDELWFRWDGKPLVLGDFSEMLSMDSTALNNYTQRYCWAWSTGNNRWSWLQEYPQGIGKNASGGTEMISVTIGHHNSTSKGRSYTSAGQPTDGRKAFEFELTDTKYGRCFEEQWSRALSVNPPLVMITGWNEWVAGRWEDKSGTWNANTWNAYSGSHPYTFVDAFNTEFSRDAEMTRYDFKDNFYFQSAHYIRKFKGARAVPAASGATTIHIDGDFAQWKNVSPAYLDDLGDTFHRDHPMNVQTDPLREEDEFYYINDETGQAYYTNFTGRNDLDTMKIARDDSYVYFYVKSKDPLSEPEERNWLNLFINTDGNLLNGWEGFDYMIGREIDTETGVCTVDFSYGGWAWSYVGDVCFRYEGSECMLAVPREMLNLTQGGNLTLDFKWADNLPYTDEACDPMLFYDMGDTAPNARFKYRYNASFSAMSKPATYLPLVVLDVNTHADIQGFLLESYPSASQVEFLSTPNRGTLTNGIFTPDTRLGKFENKLLFVLKDGNGARLSYGTVVLTNKKNAAELVPLGTEDYAFIVDEETKNITLTVPYNYHTWDMVLSNTSLGIITLDGKVVDGKTVFSLYNPNTAELVYTADGIRQVYTFRVNREKAPEKISNPANVLSGALLPGDNSIWKHTQSAPLQISQVLGGSALGSSDMNNHCVFGLREPYLVYPYELKYDIYVDAPDEGKFIGFTNIRSITNNAYPTSYCGIWFGLHKDSMYLMVKNSDFQSFSSHSKATIPNAQDPTQNFVTVRVRDYKSNITISAMNANGEMIDLFFIDNIGSSSFSYHNLITGAKGTGYAAENSIQARGYMSFFHHAGAKHYYRNITLGKVFEEQTMDIEEFHLIGANSRALAHTVNINQADKTITVAVNSGTNLKNIRFVATPNIHCSMIRLQGKTEAQNTTLQAGKTYTLLAVGGGSTKSYTVKIIEINAPVLDFENATVKVNFDTDTGVFTANFPANIVLSDLKIKEDSQGIICIDGVDARYNRFQFQNGGTHTLTYTIGNETYSYTLKIQQDALPGIQSNTVTTYVGNALFTDSDLWAGTQWGHTLKIENKFGAASLTSDMETNNVFGLKETIFDSYILEYDVAIGQIESYAPTNITFTNIRSSTNGAFPTSYCGIWFGLLNDRFYLLTKTADFKSQDSYAYATIPNAVDTRKAFATVRVIDRVDNISLCVKNASGRFVEVFYIYDITGSSYRYVNNISGICGIGNVSGNSIKDDGYISFFHHNGAATFIKNLKLGSCIENPEATLSDFVLTDPATGAVVSDIPVIQSTVAPFTVSVTVPHGIDVSRLKVSYRGSLNGGTLLYNGSEAEGQTINFSDTASFVYKQGNESYAFDVVVSVADVPTAEEAMRENDIRVMIQVTDTKEEKQTPFVVAYYDEKGVLLSVKTKTLAVKPGVNTAVIPVADEAPEGTQIIRVFTYANEIGSIRPIASKVEMTNK